MNLYYCEANGVFGRFGDYVWACGFGDARTKFFIKHRVQATHVCIER